MWWSQLFALGTCIFLLCLLSLHPCSLSGADAFIGSVLRTVPLTQPTFERYFLSLLFPLSNTDDVNRAHTRPVLQNGHHRSLPSSTPHILKSHVLWPQANHFTSLSSSSLLPKPFFWWVGHCLSLSGTLLGKSRSCLSWWHQVQQPEITTSGKTTVRVSIHLAEHELLHE